MASNASMPKGGLAGDDAPKGGKPEWSDAVRAEAAAKHAETHHRRTSELVHQFHRDLRAALIVMARERKLAEAAAKRAKVESAKKPRIVIGGAPAPRGYARMFTPARQNEYLAHRFDGKWPSEAAKLTGIPMSEVVRVRKVSPEFVEQETLAEHLVAERAAQAMVDMMHDDPRAATWVAKHFNPEKYGDKAVELKVSGQIDVNQGDPDSEIRHIFAALAERRALALGPGDDPDVFDAELV